MYTETTLIYLTILTGVVILSVFLIYFLITVIRQHKIRIRLERRLTVAEIETLEKERKRIAADMHDDLAPMLASVGLQLSTVITADRLSSEIMARSVLHIEQLLRTVRSIINDMEPAALTHSGLTAALQNTINSFNTKEGLHISMDSDEELYLSPDVRMHLFRILHELLHNALRHAHARRIHVTLKREGKKLTASVEDDGIGFDYEKKKNEGLGLGLANIVNRTTLLGGELFADSAAGKGSYFKITIPYEQ